MSDKKRLLKSIIFGVIFSLLAATILVCITAVIVMKIGLLSANLTDYIMIGIVSVACFFGGFVSARLNKASGLICGSLTGFVVFIAVTLAGLSSLSDTITLLTLIRFISTLLLSAIGGILGVNQKEEISIK